MSRHEANIHRADAPIAGSPTHRSPARRPRLVNAGVVNAGIVAACAMAACALHACAGCYSFRTGSAPAHLHTIGIEPSDDVSGFGRGTIRQDLTDLLVRRFRDDNTLRVVDASGADSRLEATITTIRTNERLNLSGTEYETVRGVYIEVRATFFDNVKKREVFKDRTVQGRSQYLVDQGLAGENKAIHDALEKLTEELLNAAVADW